MNYVLSFLEGIITFISPCLLPMLPLYISYFAGNNSNTKNHLIKNACGFIIGFTLVFVCMGALAGTFGLLLSQYTVAVNIITGSVVVLFGLYYLGVFHLPVFKGFSFSKTDSLGFGSSVLFGIVFSVGWTPCVGAFLGSALMLAANRGSIMEGSLMLLCFSLGLGIPFFISTLLIERLKSAFSFIKRHYTWITRICGGWLILMGILMITGLFGRMITLFV